MLRTVSIKLEADKEQKTALLKTTYTFNAACNFASQYAFDNRIFSKYKLQKAIYYILRKKFNLSSQFAIRVMGRVCDTYKIDKTIQHIFNRNSSVEYDLRLLNWNNLKTISLLTADGRVKLPIQFGAYSNLTLENIRNSAKLICKNKIFYLQAAMEVAEAEVERPQNFLGIDLGIVNIATVCNGTNYTSKETENIRIKTGTIRRKLQAAGTKSAKRHLKKLSKRERNFKRNINHIISKQLVAAAKRHNLVICMEDLYNFKKTVRKEQRERFGKWAFAELLSFIIYKAKIAGVAVVLVDPRDTSRTCHRCNYYSKENRKTQEIFCCKNCGLEMNADENAAINIKNRGINAAYMVKLFSKVLSRALMQNESFAVNVPIVAIKKQHPSWLQQDKQQTAAKF